MLSASPTVKKGLPWYNLTLQLIIHILEQAGIIRSMAKRKSRRQRGRQQREQTSPETLRRQGADAFHRGDYDLAIAAWRRVSRAHRDPDFTTAFAEVCFRRGLQGHMDSLRQAVEIAEDEPRYTYHLALAHHRAGRLDAAEPLYRRALDQAGEQDPFGPRAAYALGLLLLETDRRPSRDPFWERLNKVADGSPLAETRRRLAWAEAMIYARSAPSGPAPGVLWEALAARRAGRKDPTPITPATLPGAVATVAQSHLAARAWDEGDAENAFAHWRAAHEAGLDFVKDNLFAAARTLATQRLKADDAGGSVAAASVGLSLQPDDNGLRTIAGQAHFRLGHIAATAGRWDEAYEHWLAALDAGGERSRRLVINLALAQEQRENWYEAAELWREALRRRPRKADHPDALNDTQVARLWRHVAQSYQRVGDTYEALNTFRNALKWAPEDVELRTAYVDMLLDDGRLLAAENQLDDLIQAHPNDVDLLDRRAQVYAGQGYLYAAIRDWKRILEVQPDHPSARRQIARQYEILGDDVYQWGAMQEALAYYQQGLEYAPEDGMLLVSSGMCHLELGDEKLARQFFERAYAAEPTNANVYLLAIKTWLDHGDQESSQAVIQRARQAMELTPGFFLDLADHCYGWQLAGLAYDYIVEARTLASNDPNLLLVIAERAGRGGDLTLAQEIIQDVVKIDPDNPVAYLIQGLVLVSQGDIKAARRSWNRAEQIARDTDNEAVLLAVQEMRFFYDPDRQPFAGFLRRMMSDPTFDDGEWVEDEEWPDDDEEWF